MEFITAIISPVVESLMVPIKKHFGYLISSPNYVRKMGTKMKQLDGKKVDIEKRKEANNTNNLEIPHYVSNWLEQVETIKAEAESIPIDINGCFNMRMRYKVGRKSSEIFQEIDRLIKEESETKWTNHQKPLGKVDSKKASTSAPSRGSTQNDFESRDSIFNVALEYLQPDNPTQMIALCGMGGVGKTTMMEQLKKAVEDKKMLDWIVKAVIGKKVDPINFQQDIADYMGQALTETSKTARADRLHKRFGEMSQDGKKKILVVLDDVWDVVDLKDIGLSPLPNQGVGFKLLLTSRDENVCTQVGVETNSIFRVDRLTDLEAENFFWQIAQPFDKSDPELNQVGEDIVRRCGGLPIAIKIIATTLKNKKSKDEWKDALSRLKHHDLEDNLHEIFEMSYNNLKKDDHKAIFLLSGLFPDDFDISIEELMRYGWGLKLFTKVYTLEEARHRTNTCIREIISANLLIESDHIGCVKMHDLLHAFVLSNLSKVKQASIVNHRNMSEWPTQDTSESYERILLKCTGMSEFPVDFKYPSLTLLKLMHGDKLHKFPEDFYERIEKLEVVAYESMHTPLLPVTLQYSTKLRTLCLRSCSLVDDISLIGNLTNLEILSFAHCSIRKLPSMIGKLTKLKLLDLTGCVDLRIDDGVFQNLVHLKELYKRVSASTPIRFTDANCHELETLSRELFALEVEFFKNKAQPKNVSFKKLERFMISMGCHLEDKEGNERNNIYSFKNTLKLVTNYNDLLECKINELFEKTEELYLQVNDMSYLEDVLLATRQSFYKLRVLNVYKCADLRYLFTGPMAKGLTKLERLTISMCPVMEVLVYSENSGAQEIKFKELKFLSLDNLPKMVSLGNTAIVIELPQLVELRLVGLPNVTSIFPENKSTSSMSSNCSAVVQPFLNKEVVIPKLEILEIGGMKRLKEIWPCEITSSEEVNISTLRVIRVNRCDSLVNLFPCNPLSILHHLEELLVENCGSIEVLFNIDLGCVKEESRTLRKIKVVRSGKLREVWRLKGVNNSYIPIRGFQTVEWINIEWCESFRNVFTPCTTNFDLRSLKYLWINGVGNWKETGRNTENVESSQKQKVNVIFKDEISEVDDNIPGVELSSFLLHTCHHLETLWIKRDDRVEVVFEMESASSRELATTRNNQQPLLLLPHLKDLYLYNMEMMSHVWKCNWNKFLVSQKQLSESSFHNLTNIRLDICHNIKYLFSPLMAKLLSNLKEVHIIRCNGIEEVVSNRDDEDGKKTTFASASSHTNTNFFPHLDLLRLQGLPRLERIDGGGAMRSGSNKNTSNISTTITSVHDHFQQRVQVVADSWSLYQYARKILIYKCHALSSVIPSYAIGQIQKLEVLSISDCNSMIKVFEIRGINNNGDSSTNVDEGTGGTDTTLKITILKDIIVPELLTLKILSISKCDLLQHVFTFSMLESLKQLKELTIENCKAMQVIVKEENGENSTIYKGVVFPRLESLTLVDLPNLKGFFLGMNDFQWPLLDKVKIDVCPQMMVFTSGHSMAPKLNYMHTRSGKHSLECGLNFRVTTTLHETQFLSLDGTSSCPTSEGLPWHFPNLIEIEMDWISNVKKIIPSNELLQVQKLEKIQVNHCDHIEEVFEALKGTNSGLNESQYVVKLPNLGEMELIWLSNLKYIWKSKEWTVLEFPNLTRVSIDGCRRLEHVFTCSMVGSLLQLQELHISDCKSMEVIVKEANVVLGEEEVYAKVKEIMLPCLKSLKLETLPSLKGFCLGKEDFSWPTLDTLEIKKCPKLTVFTNGHLATQKLEVIDTSFGMCYVREDLNSFIKTKQQEEFKF